MKATELRIGNYVKKDFKIFKVTSLSSSTIGYSTGKCYQNKDVEPILLTEELLLKCGFVEDYGGFCKNNVYLTYGRSTRGTNLTDFDLYLTHNYWLVSRSKIEYLHQLQNLYFALTGEELEIK